MLKNMTLNLELSHMKSTAHGKKNINFRMNSDLVDRKYKIDDPDVYQLDNIIEETT